MKRLETGVVQVDEDWPGIFMRGDCALPSGHNLDAICGLLDKGLPVPAFEIRKLRGLAKLLQSCNAHDNPTVQNIMRDATER